MRLGSKRPTEPLGVDWLARRLRREAIARDFYNDGDGKPLIGSPLGRRQIVLNGIIAREEFKQGQLIAWHDRDKTQPVLEYPDGTREVVFSLSETNWRR